MKEHDLLWAMLPGGLEAFFELEDFQANDRGFRIILIEKNLIPADIPPPYHGKRVLNTILKPSLIDFFPIKGKKTEIILKRRWWQFEAVDKFFTRDIKVCAEGTKLVKEFADFLKELD